MMTQASWTRFGKVLHRTSYLKIGFYLLGFYYQFMTYFGNPREFVHHLCSSLFMFGLAMLMEGLRDNELAAAKKYRDPKARLGRHQWVIAVAIVMFSFAVLLGLFLLFYVRDKFQGEAVLAFGIGGLALFRLEYDCLSHALALREQSAARPPAASAADPPAEPSGPPAAPPAPTPPPAIP